MMLLEIASEIFIYLTISLMALYWQRVLFFRYFQAFILCLVLPLSVLSKLFFVENSYYSRVDFVLRALLYTPKLWIPFLVLLGGLIFFLYSLRGFSKKNHSPFLLSGGIFLSYLACVYFLIMSSGLRDDYFVGISLGEPSRNFAQESSEVSRFIAHSSGYPDGVAYTNSLEGLQQSERAGYRQLELDLRKTSDGILVGLHKWREWAKNSGYTGDLPPSYKDFVNTKIAGKYHPMSSAEIQKWFSDRPHLTLVTDKIESAREFRKAIPGVQNVWMETFDWPHALEAAHEHVQVMLSRSAFITMEFYDTISQLQAQGIDKLSLSRLEISGRKRFLLNLKKHNINVYLYNIEDANFSFCRELGYAYGMYVGTWTFNQNSYNCTKYD